MVLLTKLDSHCWFNLLTCGERKRRIGGFWSLCSMKKAWSAAPKTLTGSLQYYVLLICLNCLNLCPIYLSRRTDGRIACKLSCPSLSYTVFISLPVLVSSTHLSSTVSSFVCEIEMSERRGPFKTWCNCIIISFHSRSRVCFCVQNIFNSNLDNSSTRYHVGTWTNIF